MRGLIIDYARSRHALKRGGQVEITTIGSDVAARIYLHQTLAGSAT